MLVFWLSMNLITCLSLSHHRNVGSLSHLNTKSVRKLQDGNQMVIGGSIFICLGFVEKSSLKFLHLPLVVDQIEARDGIVASEPRHSDWMHCSSRSSAAQKWSYNSFWKLSGDWLVTICRRKEGRKEVQRSGSVLLCLHPLVFENVTLQIIGNQSLCPPG